MRYLKKIVLLKDGPEVFQSGRKDELRRIGDVLNTGLEAGQDHPDEDEDRRHAQDNGARIEKDRLKGLLHSGSSHLLSSISAMGHDASHRL